MKKQIKKLVIATIIWVFLLVALLFNRIYAENDVFTMSIEPSATSYSVGDTVTVKVKLSKKVLTASFYLNYQNSEILRYEANNPAIAARDYPEDNLVRVVYADLSGVGTDEIDIVFTVLPQNITDTIEFNLTNITMSVVNEDTPYTEGTIVGANSIATVAVGRNTSDPVVTPTPTPVVTPTPTPVVTPTPTPVAEATPTPTPTSTTGTTPTPTPTKAAAVPTAVPTAKVAQTTVTDQTTAKSALPQTGENDMFIALLAALVLVTLYMGYNAIKINKYFRY